MDLNTRRHTRGKAKPSWHEAPMIPEERWLLETLRPLGDAERWVVKEVEIDPVGAEAREAALDALLDVGGVEAL